VVPKRIDRDPQLQLELDYCVPKGIPHSEFLAWSQIDRDKAIAWVIREMKACPNCGTRGEEWDPKQGGHRRAYVAEIRGCEGCIVKLRAENSEELTQGRGRRVVLIPNPLLRMMRRAWGGRLGPRAASS
jgi:hypothetical protein